MFKKSLLILAIVSGAIALTGCKSKSKNNPQPPIDNGGGNIPSGSELDITGITNNNFFANHSFDFSDAVTKKYKLMEGTSFETPVKRHSFYFAEQQILVSEKKANEVNKYCELYIETNPKVKGQEIEFVEGTHLKVGTVSTFKNNNDVSFNIVLQADFSKQFQLFCKNVQTVDEVNFHIGHVLLITQDDGSGPVGPKKIGFKDDQFSLSYSQGSSFVLLQGTMGAQKLSKNKMWARLAWRLCNSTNGNCYTDWEYIENGTKVVHPGTINVSLEVNKKVQVNKVIKNMSSLQLQFSVDAEDNSTGEPLMTHFVKLGDHCSADPEKFINSDFNSQGCP